MLQYSTPQIEILRFKRVDILYDSEYWLGGDGKTKPPGDATDPGYPDDPINPGSILDIILN